MKKYFLIFVFVVNSFALSSLSGLSSDNKDILNTVLSNLKLSNVSESMKERIYKKFSFALEDKWYVKWWNNDTPANSKVANNNTKFLEMVLVNKNRIYDFTFIYFGNKKQLFTITRQFIPVNSDLLLKKFKTLKNNKDYTVRNETSNYAYLAEKGYMSDVIIHIKNSYGILSYIDMTTLNIK